MCMVTLSRFETNAILKSFKYYLKETYTETGSVKVLTRHNQTPHPQISELKPMNRSATL